MPSALISISTRAWLRAKSSTSSSRGTRSPAKSALNQRPASNWRTWSPKRSATNPVPLVVRLSAASCKTHDLAVRGWRGRRFRGYRRRSGGPFRKRPTYSLGRQPRTGCTAVGNAQGGDHLKRRICRAGARGPTRGPIKLVDGAIPRLPALQPALGKFIGRVGQRPRAGYDRGHWVPTVAVHNRRSRVVASDDEYPRTAARANRGM